MNVFFIFALKTCLSLGHKHRPKLQLGLRVVEFSVLLVSCSLLVKTFVRSTPCSHRVQNEELSRQKKLLFTVFINLGSLWVYTVFL